MPETSLCVKSTRGRAGLVAPRLYAGEPASISQKSGRGKVNPRLPAVRARTLHAGAAALSASMQGAMGDVAAVKRTLPAQPADRRIGALARRGKIAAQRTHAEHAPARRHHATLRVAGGAAVEHLLVAIVDVVQARDRIARAHASGVTGGGHHHANGGAAVPARAG